MLPKRMQIAIVLFLLATSSAVAQSAGTSDALDALAISASQHRPRIVAPGTRPPYYDPLRHVTVSYNTIWTGYAVTGSDFTYVQGSWIVHSVDCTKTQRR